ncbi:MAG: hypothetical protein ACKO0N_10880, partial [Planctomycetota bacterium]
MFDVRAGRLRPGHIGGVYVNKLDFVEDFRVDGWAFLSLGACRLRLGHCPDVIPMSQAPDHSW